MKDSQNSAKYALIYTLLVSVILLSPLFFYFTYMKNVYSVQNELLLKEKSLLIIKAMQEYNQNDEYFEYPRFKTFESGLYDKSFQPIFSLLDYKVNYFKDGYHLDGNDAYLIIKLPENRYFGAKYLIIKNKLSFSVIYEKIMYILISIATMIFVLSIFFLQTFAKPFKKMNEQLDNFIKDSIHEINTPLSIINVNIDLYNRKNKTNKYLQRIKAATKVLSHIYNDMDYLVKFDKFDHVIQKINMSEFLSERVEYFSEIALMKNITINVEINECSEIYMSEKELQRLIDNTISNSIKYSYESSKIDIKLYKKDSKCHMCFIDYGVGINKVDKIFSRYYREDNSKGGFGIGLNIVKAIINRNNIELKIDSNPKQGSKFLYIFPKTCIKK